jgi:hypothetical protein
MEHLLHSALLRQCFPFFVAQTVATVSPGVRYLPNWHIDAIAEYLEAARRREIRRLVINLPPRYLKSIMVNVAWPAFLLGQEPTTRIISASFAHTLSIKHAVDTRLVMQSAWYRALFPDTRLSADQNEKTKFVTTARGHRIAVSVGSAVTGEGGDFLIVDDPLNPQQALNAARRAEVVEWFDHTFATRLDDKRRGVIVVVMQRLHAGDLSGVLMERGGWETLVLPALAEKPQTLVYGRFSKHRAAGEPLHGKREDAAMLESIRRDMGAAAYMAQYQQQPASDAAGMIRLEWFGRYKF